LHKNPYCGIN